MISTNVSKVKQKGLFFYRKRDKQSWKESSAKQGNQAIRIVDQIMPHHEASLAQAGRGPKFRHLGQQRQT